ncbi:MAG: arylsulfatase A-like enzyme [Verrucomicrobiales bacterium]|jgi:arylsulfatase A-like enzyme
MKNLAALLLFLLTTSSQAAEKPNFVWIISEDNSHHYLEHFFPGGAPTPNIVQMAERGITYDHAFSNAPVCSVARSTLITSCYAPRIGTQYHRRSAMAPMPEGLRMFPAYLRDAGYYTTNRSKEDYNAIKSKDVWDDSSRKSHWHNRKEGQPFFHKVTFAQSHEGSLHFSKQQMESQPTKTDPKTIQLPPYHPDTPTFRYTHARYRDSIRTIDGLVGQVIADLEKDGELENTFVFYFGDHGGVLPRGKGYAYESGLHVPLVVRIPENFKHLVDAKPGSRAKGFVSFIDFGPTVLNLAGAAIPQGIDGKSFLGNGVTWGAVEKRDTAFGYADRFDEKYDLVRTLRKANFTYQRNYQPFNFDSLQNDYRYKMIAYREWRDLFKAGKLNEAQSQFHLPRSPEALYDIETDPHEINNLATNPKHAAKLTEMRELLTEQVKKINDLSFHPEPHMVEAAMQNPVAFGKQHSAEIASIIDIANLQLIDFRAAEAQLEAALDSNHPWKQYWACIVASSHGKSAIKLKSRMAKLAAESPVPLVRTRAAEFLGLIGEPGSQALIKAALLQATTPTEANLILNTATLLQDGQAAQKSDLSEKDVTVKLDRYVTDRIAYLSGKPKPAKPKRGKKKNK